MGLAAFGTLISGHWLRCKADHELVTTSVEYGAHNESFMHPNLGELSGVWIEEEELAGKDVGVKIECEPRVLEVKGGKEPNVLNVVEEGWVDQTEGGDEVGVKTEVETVELV
jgi:hypothetical protein